MTYSTSALEQMLQAVRDKKQNPNTSKVRPWTDFQPQALTYQVPQDDAYQQLQDQVTSTDQAATALAETKAQNAYAYKHKQDASEQYQAAQQGSNKAVQPGGKVVDWDNEPLLGSGGANPKASMETYNFHGMNYTVNSSVGEKFAGFLSALWKKGYHPTSIQGYANRNIAGTNTKSLHSLGFAIDIDPARNPVYYNGVGGVYALPPSVGALAAKYGLSWGGNWKNKKDYMHFSVPYGGRQ